MSKPTTTSPRVSSAHLARQWLLDYLASGGGIQRAEDVIEQGAESGISMGRLYRARAHTGVRVHYTNVFPRRSYWIHPDSPQHITTPQEQTP